MKIQLPRALSALLILLVSQACLAQGWTDPAINHSRLFRQKLGDGHYTMIATYKVKGSPYLFAGKYNSNMYSTGEKAYNIDIQYNTYNQDIEFFSTSNSNTPLVKVPGEVDSFVLKQDFDKNIVADMRFIYGSFLGSKEKAYFLEIATGKRFNLYKRYKSELGYVSENYVQSELRQFDLVTDYFYFDSETKSFKKLKWNLNNIIKEFKNIKDITAVANNNDFVANPEAMMITVFDYLNN